LGKESCPGGEIGHTCLRPAVTQEFNHKIERGGVTWGSG